MGKSVAVKKNFTFVGGLNTVAGPLTSPPNTWVDGDNMVPEVDGSISLRLAMDYEPSYSLSSVTRTSADAAGAAYGSWEWNSVAGNGNHNFIVVQQGKTVSFYVNNGASVSASLKSFTINLTTYLVTGNPETTGIAPIDCSSVNGALLIVSRDTEPLLVTYDPATDGITVTQLTIQIRDFIGVYENVAIDNRPGTLTDTHNYNLLNQGWNTTNITAYFGVDAKYPSNAQSWTAGKDTSDNFSSALLDKQDFGTSPAPKGRFILNVFSRDRTTASGVANITTETEYYRPTTCAFMAQRAWYAGVRSNTIANWVMFSQVAETTRNLGKCYQDADPTSEVISDLVKTDGGVIPIQDCGAIIKLMPFGNSMLVLADNGVWQIVGGIDGGFAANSYEVRRLSAVGCVSAKSAVRVESSILFWGDTAVYSLAINQIGGVTVEPITLANISTTYEDIPVIGKLYSAGVYDPVEKVVCWLYNDSTAQDGNNWRYNKNRLLCFNTRLNAWYTHSISSLSVLSPHVVDAFMTKARSFVAEPIGVLAGGSTVLSGGSTVVTTGVPSGTYSISEMFQRFLTIHEAGAGTFYVTMSGFDTVSVAPNKFRDWHSRDSVGATYEGFILPGYDFGEGVGADKNFQALYVLVYMRRSETGVDSNGDPINPSSCMMQGRWDWTDSATPNRWSAEQQVYRHTRLFLPAVPSASFDDGFATVVTKNKVRGKGRTLQLKFTSEEDNDMQLLGWAVTYIGNANV